MRRRDMLASGAVLAAGGMAGCLGDDDEGDQEKTDKENDGAPSDGDSDGIEIGPSTFVTVWQIPEDGGPSDDNIRLPLLEEGNYDFVVDWGDGTTNMIVGSADPGVTHTYDEPGKYVIAIEGTVEGWSFVERDGPGMFADTNKLLEIRQWGEFDVSLGGQSTDSEELPPPRTDFAWAQNLIVTAEDSPATEAGTSLASLFANTDLSEASGFTEWDTSNIEDMRGMFDGAASFSGDVSEWDVSSVEDMNELFLDTESFSGGVSDWNVSAVKDMSGMFARAEAFDGDVGGWNVSNVENLAGMFYRATSFSADLNKWNVSSVTDMSELFRDAESFDGNLSDWDVSNVRDMNSMFEGAESFDGDLTSSHG